MNYDHRLRAEFNYSNSNAYIRQLATDELFSYCAMRETEEHILVDCTKYNECILKLKHEIMKVNEILELNLLDVVLYEENLEKLAQKWHREGNGALSASIDAAIKGFHREILVKRADEALGARAKFQCCKEKFNEAP